MKCEGWNGPLSVTPYVKGRGSNASNIVYRDMLDEHGKATCGAVRCVMYHTAVCESTVQRVRERLGHPTRETRPRLTGTRIESFVVGSCSCVFASSEHSRVS